MTRRSAVLIGAFATALLTPAQAQQRERFTTAAMNRIVDVSGAIISPDGSKIAFVASRANLEKNRYDDTLYIFDLRASTMREAAPEHASAGSLAWSPDSTKLAAVLDDKAGDTDQLFTIDASSGTLTQLTRGKTAPADIAWNPRGDALAFIRTDYPPVKTGTDVFRDGFEVSDNAYLSTKAAQPDALWTVTLDGSETRLTSGPHSVADATPSWSPDGRFILFGQAPNGIYGLQDRVRLMRYDLSAHNAAALTPELRNLDQPLYAPDGNHVLYLRSRDNDPANETDVVVASPGARAERNISRKLDRHVSTAAWMPDSRSTLLRINDATRAPLVVQALDGRLTRLPLGGVIAAGISPQQSVARDGTIAFSGDTQARPAELYILKAGERAPRQLTHFNDWLSTFALGTPARITWRADGFNEDGVLTYPPGYVRGKKYPLVLRIHGGPTQQSRTGFDPFYQLAAARGYLVFAPNYRGSNGLGNAYEHAIFNDASIGPGKDVLAGIAALKRLGIVDEHRIGISGWSYGGLLTSWLETQSTMWRAAVAGAAVNDLVVDYAIADDIDADAIGFTGGSPYRGNSLDVWRKHSPITYFKNVRTPTLILCNVYDVRVPIVESYEMFHALRDNNVPVQFYAYPTSGHLPRGPVRMADVYERWLAWFDRYLK